MRGVVKFFCDEDIPSPRKWGLRTTVEACGVEVAAGPLYATSDKATSDKEKASWFSKTAPVEGPKEHILARRWQCCCGGDELDDTRVSPVE